LAPDELFVAQRPAGAFGRRRRPDRLGVRRFILQLDQTAGRLHPIEDWADESRAIVLVRFVRSCDLPLRGGAFAP
jgi:hypothetical protein